MSKHIKKIILGVTGASGAIYANSIINKLVNYTDIQTDIIFSDNARLVWEYELENDDYKKLPLKIYKNNDFFTPPASGSAAYDAMIICPCSVGTMGKIASGLASDLISRSADVILKQRKKLILVLREAPYNLIHIKNMETINLAGGIICPANPYFYNKPKNIEQIISTVTDRVLDLAGIETGFYRWGE